METRKTKQERDTKSENGMTMKEQMKEKAYVIDLRSGTCHLECDWPPR